MIEELFGVCRPELLEAPASWMTRAAAGQGLTLKELCRWLGVRQRNDVDMNFHLSDIGRIAKCCGLLPQTFDQVQRILSEGASLRLVGEVFLRLDGNPRYRFCPLCLKEQGTPHFPVHWRLGPWRMCHTHHCLMEDHCPHCRAPVVFVATDAASVRRRDITFLSQCACCADLLWKVQPVFVEALPPHRLSPLEAARLRNGCAFASALAHGRMSSPFCKSISSVQGLPLMERFGLLAGATFPSADQFRMSADLRTVDREFERGRVQCSA